VAFVEKAAVQDHPGAMLDRGARRSVAGRASRRETRPL